MSVYETGLVMKKKGKKSTSGIGASLTPDYREKEESNYSHGHQIQPIPKFNPLKSCLISR